MNSLNAKHNTIAYLFSHAILNNFQLIDLEVTYDKDSSDSILVSSISLLSELYLWE